MRNYPGPLQAIQGNRDTEYIPGAWWGTACCNIIGVGTNATLMAGMEREQIRTYIYMTEIYVALHLPAIRTTKRVHRE